MADGTQQMADLNRQSYRHAERPELIEAAGAEGIMQKCSQDLAKVLHDWTKGNIKDNKATGLQAHELHVDP